MNIYMRMRKNFRTKKIWPFSDLDPDSNPKPDPDPQHWDPDPRVFRPPGSGSISQRYGSGPIPERRGNYILRPYLSILDQ